MKKLFLKILQYSQETAALESLFDSEYYEIFKSTYFEEHLWTAASENQTEKKSKIANKEFQLFIFWKNHEIKL